MFDYISGKYDKFSYMDIGVCHPVVRNNTYMFYENGFTDGVLVEPNKALCDLYKIYRPENKLLNCGATGENDVSYLTYYYNDDSPGLNTFIKEVAMERNMADSFIKIPVYNINRLIEENFSDRKLNVLDIDTEGMDYGLLNALNTEKFKIDIICAEISEKITEQFMDYKGYKLYETTTENAIYILK